MSTNEHYLIIKGYCHPTGHLHFHVDPDAAYAVMNGRPIWSDDVEDFISINDTNEAEHNKLYEELSKQLSIEAVIRRIIKALNTPGEEANDGECLDEVSQILEDAGYSVFPEAGIS